MKLTKHFVLTSACILFLGAGIIIGGTHLPIYMIFIILFVQTLIIEWGWLIAGDKR